MDIAAALAHPEFLGRHPAYAQGLGTFAKWIAIHKAVNGDPLTNIEREFFTLVTGREYDPPDGGWSTIAILSPRRCGKSLFAATQAVYAAVRPGQRNTWAALLAQGRAEAQRSLLSEVSSFFDGQGLLPSMVVNRTAETIVLEGGCTIGVLPGSRPQTIRGLGCRILVGDEIDFVGEPGGEDKARQIIAAARPTIATVPGAKLVLISSPGRVGSAFHRIVTDFYGRPDPHTLVLKLDTSVNPVLHANEAYRESMRALDPLAYEAEVLGRYVEGDATLFDSSVIARCVVSGRGDIPPEAVTGRVVAGIDSAAGSKGGDSFGCVLGTQENGRLVVVAMRRFAAPFDPAVVVREIASLCRSYRCRRVVGDRFGGNLVAQLFRNEGLTYEVSPSVAGDALLDLVGVINTGAVELQDPEFSRCGAELVEDLRSIVRRPGGGRDQADAPRTARGHADLASAFAVLAAALPRKRTRPTLAQPQVIHAPYPSPWIQEDDSYVSMPF